MLGFELVLKQARLADERLRYSVDKNPVVFILIGLAMLFVMFFWNIIQLLLQGLFFVSLALGVMVAAFLLWLRTSLRPSLAALLMERKKIVEALDISKRLYMHRKLGLEDFNRIFREKQNSLIEVESMIALHSSVQGKFERQLQGIQAKKRHVLKALLEEKEKVLKKMGIAEKSYLARKIDEKTYRHIVVDAQKRLIGLESEIKVLLEEDAFQKAEEKKAAKRKAILKKKNVSQKKEKRKLLREISKQAVE
jgi:hypothetical protein